MWFKPKCAFTVCALLIIALSTTYAQDDVAETWPDEIQITPPNSDTLVHRPVGAVAGLGTLIYVATAGGQLFTVDVKSGAVALINRGGDDQRFAGLCLDSRGPGTLYAPGRDTGNVYAFNRRGELLEKFQIVASKDDGGDSFLSGCIQTRYQLIIIDSYHNRFYFLRIADEGPLRGSPPEYQEKYIFQAPEVNMTGTWPTETVDGFNAYGVEWTAKHEKMAYIMNSATGHMYACSLTKKSINGTMRPVSIQGAMNTFPGALHMLIDSRNENIMYLTLPHLNTIAVLEFSSLFPRKAKFIRMISSPLLRNAIAMSEFGDFLYPLNADFQSDSPTYSLIKLSRHQQKFDGDDPDQQFTTIYDEAADESFPEVLPISDILIMAQSSPDPIGTDAPEQVGTPPPTTGPVKDATRPDEEGNDHEDSASPSTPVSATDISPESETEEEATADDDETNSSDTNDEAEAAPTNPSVFAVNDIEPRAEKGACFSGSATVEVEGRGCITMDELVIGDRVLVREVEGAKVFSEVFMFTHQDPLVPDTYLRISTEDGGKLDVTSGHYLHANGGLVSAENIQIGDILYNAAGSQKTVQRVEEVHGRGLFNPQTKDGSIVVDGIRATTYTRSIHPVVATAMMAPLRMMHWLTGWGMVLAKGGAGYENLLKGGNGMYC